MGVRATAELHTTSIEGLDPVFSSIAESIAEVEAWVDRDNPGVGLGRVNVEASLGYYRFSDAEQDMYRLMLLALDYARASHGSFDPTVGPMVRLYERSVPASPVPLAGELESVLGQVGWQKVVVASEARSIHFRQPEMEIDLGGIAKGFALDMAARSFSQPGVRAGLLRLGGNLYAWGQPPGIAPWKVAVPDPRFPDRTLVWIHTTNRGIAVSGSSNVDRDRAPVLDPSSGLPAAGGMLAAVALADSGADADALSTALFAGGYHRAAELLERTNRVEAVLLVEGDGAPRLLASVSLEGKLELPPQIEQEIGGRIRYLLPPKTIDLPF